MATPNRRVVCNQEEIGSTPTQIPQNPLMERTLPAEAYKANSRFLTDCYLVPAALPSVRALNNAVARPSASPKTQSVPPGSFATGRIGAGFF